MFSRRKASKTGQATGYWQSYSDMMAALLLMFVLIMAFTLAQSLQTYEEKVQIQEAQQKKLTEQQEILTKQQDVLAEQQKLLAEQQEILSVQQEQLKVQQVQIDELIGVKTEIIEALNEAFKGSNLRIDIDAQTGAISLDSSILFGFDSSELTKAGTAFLKDFLPRYISVLLGDEFRPYISEIIIEGHTDTDGKYMYNLNLSQKRAYSVAAYCLDEKTAFLPVEQVNELRGIMTANGKSFSNPIYNADGSVNAERSRRVEIKFRLQDEEMIAQLQEILEGKTE